MKNTLEKLIQFIPNTHLFIELRPGIQESFAHKLAKKLKLEVIATGDVYFRDICDHDAHVTLRAIDNNIKIDVILANYFSSGIDTKKDLDEYIKLLNKQ